VNARRETGRLTLDQWLLNMAVVVAARSTCPRKAVGCVITDRAGRVLSVGYNGAPRGAAHCSETSCAEVHGECVRAVHAEVNALLNAGGRVEGAVVYCTHLPCPRCAGALAQAGVGRVVYREERGSPHPAEEALVREFLGPLLYRLGAGEKRDD
jgi:dCMP deaminase